MKKLIYLSILVLVAAACNREGKFAVSGTVEGAGDSTVLVLEQSSSGYWYIMDTVRTHDDGAFSLESTAPQFPSIYRLRLEDGRQICFPVDSLDRLTLTTSLAGYGREYDLAGSEDAVEIMTIDKEAMRFAVADTANAEFAAWKEDLARRIVAGPSSMPAYYAINKWIGGKPVFDPSDKQDIRIIGAVANSFNEYRKGDPRTSYLVNLLLAVQRERKAATAPAAPIKVTEASLLPIKLQDYRAYSHDLQEVASRNRVVLLNFTMYDQPFSPALNRVINDAYTAHHSAGFEVYQVCLDADAVQWQQAAQNVPWISVYEPAGTDSRALSSYAVDHVPTSFIIVGGEIVKRVDDATLLEGELKKYL